MAYSQTWLESASAIRGVLVEVMVGIVAPNGITVNETSIYISNIGYVTGDASITFSPIIKDSVSISESLSLDGNVSMSFGDIAVSNDNGDLDIWLDPSYIWTNRNINVYVGDPRWVCNTLTDIKNSFLLVFSGVVSDVDSSARDTLNIKIRDKLEKLNYPISDNKMGNTYFIGTGDTQTNQEEIRPLVFGEVFNIEPVLYDPSLLQYMYNDGSSEGIIEVRDNGVPIEVTDDPSSGTFTLPFALYGTITASVQGVKKTINLDTGALSNTYTNSIAHLIATIATQYGKATAGYASGISVSDIDLINLKAFYTSNNTPVGVYISGKENTISICQRIANSVGAQVYFNRIGKLQLIRIGDRITTGLSVTSITDLDILHHSLSISEKLVVSAAKKVSYCTNYTIQGGLLTGIPTEHKELFEKDVEIAAVEDDTVATKYRLSKEVEPIPSLLLRKVDAEAEATRLNTLFKAPHITYTFTGTSRLLSLVLGQEVTLTHSRFGLQVGKIGQIISLNPNWITGTIEVGVLI